ncbi:unnamed protein product [Ranitomeya imitator]|uniref:Uncharacterized protein n=1 Tax=Ranitomeya imitator TaxID=111125 RepID=A0ABN9LEP3_9NEOB|nr:unnamed protein product [Ranitomeya imitator]
MNILLIKTVCGKWWLQHSTEYLCSLNFLNLKEMMSVNTTMLKFAVYLRQIPNFMEDIVDPRNQKS